MGRKTRDGIWIAGPSGVGLGNLGITMSRENDQLNALGLSLLAHANKRFKCVAIEFPTLLAGNGNPLVGDVSPNRLRCLGTQDDRIARAVGAAFGAHQIEGVNHHVGELFVWSLRSAGKVILLPI